MLKPSPKTNLPEEEWREIDGYKNYEVSSFGRVYSRKYKRIMSPSKRDDNRLSVKLRKSGEKVKSWKVHRLVAIAFIGNPENKPEIDHMDSNPQNNCVTNLRWVTHKENCEVVYKRGRKKVTGEMAVTAKLKNSQAKQIREWYSNKTYSVSSMSKMFSISENSLRAIIRNKTYIQ